MHLGTSPSASAPGMEHLIPLGSARCSGSATRTATRLGAGAGSGDATLYFGGHVNRTLDLLVVFAVAIAGGLAAIVFMRAYPPASTAGETFISKLNVGAHLAQLPGYAWRSHPATLVLALHVGCPYCEASMGFYERLHVLEERGEAGAHLLGVFNDSASEAHKEPSASLSGIETRWGVDFGELGVGSTPTILLVDSGGIARGIWRGELSPERENEVVSSVRIPRR